MLGKPAIDTLSGARVAVFGVGGVGGYVVEVLARSGVGELDIFDDDRVCLTNVNRQIYALISTVGKHKVDVAADRVHDINPRCRVRRYQMFYHPDNADKIDLSLYDYVVDCIDTVKAKLELVRRCHKLGVPIISCMGAANKLDATALRVADLSKTSMDPLAKVMRKTLRKEGITHLKVVYSEEPPLRPIDDDSISCRFHCICPDKDMRKCTERRDIPASNAFVPAAAGLIAGGEVVKDLVKRAGTFRLSPEEAAQSEAAKQAAEKAAAHLQRHKECREQRKAGLAVDEKVVMPLPVATGTDKTCTHVGCETPTVQSE